MIKKGNDDGVDIRVQLPPFGNFWAKKRVNASDSVERIDHICCLIMNGRSHPMNLDIQLIDFFLGTLNSEVLDGCLLAKRVSPRF